jgi:hypothetical protein
MNENIGEMTRAYIYKHFLWNVITEFLNTGQASRTFLANHQSL